MKYKMGLRVLSQPQVRLCDYYTPDLPSVDSLQFPLGHADLIDSSDWGMMLNQILGCCAHSGTGHETMVLAKEGGHSATFSDLTIVKNYSACTGYQPGPEIQGFRDDGSAIINPEAPPNPTDQGTDMAALFGYRQHIGFLDDAGNRHKVAGYAALKPGDFEELLVALSLFTTVSVAIQVPEYAEAQFEAGGPWQPEPGYHKIIGAHFIPAVAAPDRNTVDVVSWGRKIGMTAAFYQAFNCCTVVSLDEEMFTGGKSVDGIDADKLAADLPLFNTGPLMATAPTPKPRRGGKRPVELVPDPAPESSESA